MIEGHHNDLEKYPQETSITEEPKIDEQRVKAHPRKRRARKNITKDESGEFSEHMTQEALIEFVKKEYKRLFPDRGDAAEAPKIPNQIKNYFYFPILDYFKRPIIDPHLISKLQQRGKLLSVGVGPAYLEEFLQKAFKIDPRNIVLSDITFKDGPQDTEMPRIQFDMTKTWPLAGNFDYILFLESFGVSDFGAKHYEYNDPYIARFTNIIEPIIGKVMAQNFDAIDERDQNLFIQLAEQDLGQTIARKYNIIREAFTNLNNEGEMRFSGHLMTDHQLVYVILKLRAEFGESCTVESYPFLRISKIPNKEK